MKTTDEEETECRVIFEKAADAIFVLDKKSGTILASNQRSAELTGFSKEELAGLHPSDISPAKYDKAAADNKIHAARKHPQVFEWQIQHKNGQSCWVEVSLKSAVIYRKERVLAFFHEIDDRKRAEDALRKSEANLRTIVNQAETAFILLDYSLGILCFNAVADAWARLAFGCPLEEGANLARLVQEDRRAEALKLMNHVLAGNAFEDEVNYPNLDGSFSWYRVSMTPVFDEEKNVFGLCISAADITAFRLAEMERGRMLSDLLQRNKDLEQFAYIVSHNLRAPVANIVGISKLLDNGKISPEERAEIERFLFASVGKLEETTQDMNKILRIKTPVTEKKETVQLSTLTDEIRVGLHTVIEEEGVQILTDFSAIDRVFSIKCHLYSIFYNLVSNSIKYRQPDKTPLVRIRSELAGGKVILTFRDNGLGIDLAQNGQYIFGLYKRFHRHKEGKGTGLFMVKALTEALGGKITATSKAGTGTEFRIEFDAAHLEE